MQTEPNKTAGGGIFVRPNLKAFFLGAALIMVVQGLISSGESGPRRTGGGALPPATSAWEENVEALLEEAAQNPRATVFMRLSRYYEKRGDYRKAIFYLRHADRLEAEEESL